MNLSRSAQPIVIVVDDDARMRESLESLLRSVAYNVVAFPCAEDTLNYPLLSSASCVVSDVRMPGMQGFDLQRRIKRDYPKLPVVLITGNYDEPANSRAVTDGAVALLYKPFDPNDLVSAIQAAIEKATRE